MAVISKWTVSKWVRRLALMVLALALIAATLWAISRAMYPTDEQREAVAVLQLAAAPGGDNAFPALWTLTRAVPKDRMQQVVERDAERIDELPWFPDADESGDQEFVTAAEQYPDLSPSPDDRDRFCTSAGERCLEKVRRDPASYRGLVDRNRELLDRIETLADYDFIHHHPYWSLSLSHLPAMSAHLSSTRNALWFVEGRVDDALAASCQGIDTWRRLGATADSILLRLIANALAVRYHGALLADMLAEIPVDQALPDECTQALAPPTAQELSLCTAVRGEFEIVKEFTGPMLERASDEDWRFGLMSFLAYDAEATDAAYAENLAPICSEKELERIAADEPEVHSTGSPGMVRLACIGNYMGCTMTSFTEQPYGSYQLRMQNFGAQLDLLATLAWLRDNADGSEPIESLLDKRPDALKSPTRDVEAGEQGDSIQIRIFDESKSETWSVPLPAELRR